MKTQRLAKVSFGALLGLVGIVGLAFPGMAFPDENDASPTITVQIYNYSQASPTVLVGAEREAGRILREAGLRVVWLECPVGPSTPGPQGLAIALINATRIADESSLRLLIRKKNAPSSKSHGTSIRAPLPRGLLNLEGTF